MTDFQRNILLGLVGSIFETQYESSAYKVKTMNTVRKNIHNVPIGTLLHYFEVRPKATSPPTSNVRRLVHVLISIA